VHPLEYEEENDLVATKFPYTPRRRKRTWWLLGAILVEDKK
jgi:hypothetical protein